MCLKLLREQGISNVQPIPGNVEEPQFQGLPKVGRLTTPSFTQTSIRLIQSLRFICSLISKLLTSNPQNGRMETLSQYLEATKTFWS